MGSRRAPNESFYAPEGESLDGLNLGKNMNKPEAVGCSLNGSQHPPTSVKTLGWSNTANS